METTTAQHNKLSNPGGRKSVNCLTKLAKGKFWLRVYNLTRNARTEEKPSLGVSTEQFVPSSGIAFSDAQLLTVPSELGVHLKHAILFPPF